MSKTDFLIGCFERSNGTYTLHIKVKCPRCGVYMTIDEDQLHGLVSILCNTPNMETGIPCGYHAYLKSKLEEV